MKAELEKKLINILKGAIYSIGQAVRGIDSGGNEAIGEIKSKILLQSYDVLYVIEYPPPDKGLMYKRETLHENQVKPHYGEDSEHTKKFDDWEEFF